MTQPTEKPVDARSALLEGIALLTSRIGRPMSAVSLGAQVTLEADGSPNMNSLRAALSAGGLVLDRHDGSLAGLVHHSDHGVQYTAHSYRHLLAEHRIRSSMGEVGNCYENALAERMNGILKMEYGLDALFVDLEQMAMATTQATALYNYDRPHLALDYRVPAEVHFA